MRKLPILLVDDDRSWTEATSRLLLEEGFEVVTAANGDEALEFVDENEPRLVILDVHLPRLGGLEILQVLRQEYGHVPVIMVSADDQSGVIAQAMAHGASTFLCKPMAASLLLRAVRHLLEETPAKNKH